MNNGVRCIVAGGTQRRTQDNAPHPLGRIPKKIADSLDNANPERGVYGKISMSSLQSC